MELFLNIMGRLPVWLLISISAAGVILGDLSAKYWSINQRPILFFFSVVGYLVSTFFYIPTLLREGLVITSLLWSLLSLLGFLFIGIIIFKETLTPIQTVGTILGAISLIILGASS